jgi:hypothetical protein
VNQGEIDLLDRAREELRCKGAMGGVVARDNDCARGTAVKAMDDSGPLGAGSRRKIPEAIQQGIHERSAMVPRARVNNHVGWFVHNDYIRVFIQNVDGDIFRTCGKGRTGNDFNLGAFALSHFVGGTRRATCDEDMAFRD